MLKLEHHEFDFVEEKWFKWIPFVQSSIATKMSDIEEEK